MKKTLILFALFLLPMLAQAEPVEVGGVFYNLDASSKTAEVTNRTGKPYTTSYTDSSITIPAIFIYAGDGSTYTVTSIGPLCFLFLFESDIHQHP